MKIDDAVILVGGLGLRLGNITKRVPKPLIKIDDKKFSKNPVYRLNKSDRKPNNGLLKKAINKWNIDINKSIFIGDKVSDKKAATKSNIKFYFKKNVSMYKQVKEVINNEK